MVITQLCGNQNHSMDINHIPLLLIECESVNSKQYNKAIKCKTLMQRLPAFRQVQSDFLYMYILQCCKESFCAIVYAASNQKC